MKSTWPITVQIIVISTLLGLGGGVLATALTSEYLSDYALALGQLSSPPRLSEERPRTTPQTYDEALRDVSESVLPSVVRFYANGSFAESFASGAVVTSDGWILTFWEYPVSGAGVTAVIGGRTYPIQRMDTDTTATGVTFVKVDAANLPVFAFGSGFSLVPGEQVFAATGSASLFAETVVESRWERGALSSDIARRRVLVADPLLGSFQGAPVVNVRGELVGLVNGGSGGFSFVIPSDGVLTTFNAMLREGEIVHPSLGVVATDIDRNIGMDASLTGGLAHGAALVGPSSVKRGSPAASAGIAPGDVIVAVDGVAVDANRSLDELVVTHAPGDTLTLRVVTAGQEREVRVTLGTL